MDRMIWKKSIQVTLEQLREIPVPSCRSLLRKDSLEVPDVEYDRLMQQLLKIEEEKLQSF